MFLFFRGSFKNHGLDLWLPNILQRLGFKVLLGGSCIDKGIEMEWEEFSPVSMHSGKRIDFFKIRKTYRCRLTWWQPKCNKVSKKETKCNKNNGITETKWNTSKWFSNLPTLTRCNNNYSFKNKWSHSKGGLNIQVVWKIQHN